MDYLPLFIDIRNKWVLVVGGGNMAAKKIKILQQCGANIKIVAQHLCDELQILYSSNQLKWIATKFNITQLQEVFLVIAATNNNKLNSEIFRVANSLSKLVNVVDDQKNCNCIFPSIINRCPIIIAICSSGTAPVLSRFLRAKLEALIPSNIGNLAYIAGKWRTQVKKIYPKFAERRYFWESLFTKLLYNNITTRNINQIETIIVRKLKKKQVNLGEIILVGAGPGDSGLLTLRGLQVMQAADVILYDYLVSQEILELARRDADLICVGKKAGLNLISQEQTNYLLITLAQQGKRIVRLKGGDPFIFGRGGEELQAISQAGIPFQVVPGITSGIGAPAYAGIPLTHRDYSHQVVFITGHYPLNKTQINWNTLAYKDQTLVIYMGIIQAANISEQLIKHGRAAQTPVAIISCGTNDNQKVLIGVLEDLKKLSSLVIRPALVVIGEVVNFHKQFSWF